MNIKITTDSTCDISPEDRSAAGIGVFPLEVILGGKALKDGIEVFPEDIFNAVEKEHKTCSTSAVSIGEYMEAFQKYSKEYDAVIHISIGDNFSSCYKNAIVASDGLDNVYIVDSKNLSSGQGGLALYAVDLVSQGYDAKTICDKLKEAADNVRFSFLIDGLDYLRRGGRCSGAAAFGANLLGIKPSIESRNGVLEVARKYRGPMAKCVREYMADQLKSAESMKNARAILVYLGIDQKIVDDSFASIKAAGVFKDVRCYEAGCTIASHCGPGTIGVYFLGEN